MFHATMGRFQLELINFYYLIFTVVPFNSYVFFPELQLLTAQARRQKKLQHQTRPVKNVVITTKGLQERKQWDDGEKM